LFQNPKKIPESILQWSIALETEHCEREMRQLHELVHLLINKYDIYVKFCNNEIKEIIAAGKDFFAFLDAETENIVQNMKNTTGYTVKQFYILNSKITKNQATKIRNCLKILAAEKDFFESLDAKTRNIIRHIINGENFTNEDVDIIASKIKSKFDSQYLDDGDDDLGSDRFRVAKIMHQFLEAKPKSEWSAKDEYACCQKILSLTRKILEENKKNEIEKNKAKIHDPI
jgi:hypothetical protein